MSTFSRRAFLKSTSLLGGGLCLLPTTVLAGTGGLGLLHYKSGAPFANDLRRGTGSDLTLQGVVYQHDGKTPLANAVVEIWHCNEKGSYDFSTEFAYRGKTKTDNEGRYCIKTHAPGKYAEKGATKMSRVFVLVTAPWYKESFSSLYFDQQKNPYIDSSHWAACPMAERPTLPKRIKIKHRTVIHYNHYLTAHAITHIPTPKEIAESRIRIFPNQVKNQNVLTFGKSRPGNVVVRIIDKQRQVVRKHVFKNVELEQNLPMDNDNLSPGLYSCSIYSSRFGDFTKQFSIQ